MAAFAISLAMGIVVGIAYGLSGIRSPAPPLVALVGLLGMVVGEHLVPIGKQMLVRPHVASAQHEASEARRADLETASVSASPVISSSKTSSEEQP